MRLPIAGFLTASFSLWFLHTGAQAPQPLPEAYPASFPVSYVRVWEARKPETNAANLHIGVAPGDFLVTTAYVDGLGRPLQTVVKKGSLASATGEAGDLVSLSTYDALGREAVKYLPYAASSGNGLLKRGNPYQAKVDFYNAQLDGQEGETNVGPDNLNWAYGQTLYEASPLNRVTQALAPGASWAGGGRGTKLSYWLNTAADAVRSWTVTEAPTLGDFGSYATPGTYGDGQLYKTVSEDERGKQVVEFKDKEGKVVLKKVQLLDNAYDGGAGSGHGGWLCTYYLYDDLNRLRCVVQPKGVELLQQNGWDIASLSGDILNEQCFRYEYDERGRPIAKRVPGTKAPVWMVYDNRDRLVMTQDANLRASGKWLVTLYDGLNRPVVTGLCSSSSDRAAHASGAAASTMDYPFSYAGQPTSGWELLTETHYDNYNGLPGGLSSSLVQSGYAAALTATAGAPDYAEAVQVSADVKGMVTWTRVKVIGENTYLNSASLYDDKGRVVQVQSLNYTGGLDVVTTQYSFAGQVLRSHVKHQKTGGVPQNLEVATKNKFDALLRLTGVEKSLNGSGWKPINALEYNALGQVSRKSLGDDPVNPGTPLETQAMEYNVRGWLLGTNRDYVKGQSTAKFGYELGYDKPTPALSTQAYAAQYNGNIAGTIWKSGSDDEARRYDFAYDNINRLTGADFNQYTGGGFNKNAGINYTVNNLSYDGNGNILTMNQYGWKVGGSPTTPVDQLTYTYETNSNRLKGVSDAQNDNGSVLGDFKYDATTKGTLGDYTYDQNGNLVSDANKKISAIDYNFLNLTQAVTVTGKGTVAYTYDATGARLKKTVTEGGQTKTTLYLFGVYENDALQYLPQEEGRIRPTTVPGNPPFVFDYLIKDHLGNVRMVLTEEQKTDPYPAATMETAAAGVEEAVYSNLPQTRSPLPAGYPANTPGGNARVAKVRGSGQKIGPAILLKVMAGDRFNLQVSSWYRLNGATPNPPNSVLTDLAQALAANVGPIAGAHGTAQAVQSSGVMTGSALQFLQAQNAYASTKPKAFVNWLLLDEQFNPAKDASGNVIAYGYSGADPVGEDGVLKPHLFSSLPISKSGYLYIYVSNETPNVDVFFDNLQVTHVRGSMLEANTFYPFGLQMAGLGSKAALFGAPANKQKFGGKEEQREEFSDGTGLELLDFGARMYDGQLGRWTAMDPLAEASRRWSAYNYAYNNPLRFVDPDGMYSSPFSHVNDLPMDEWVVASRPKGSPDDPAAAERIADKHREQAEQQKNGEIIQGMIQEAWELTPESSNSYSNFSSERSSFLLQTRQVSKDVNGVRTTISFDYSESLNIGDYKLKTLQLNFAVSYESYNSIENPLVTFIVPNSIQVTSSGNQITPTTSYHDGYKFGEKVDAKIKINDSKVFGSAARVDHWGTLRFTVPFPNPLARRGAKPSNPGRPRIGGLLEYNIAYEYQIYFNSNAPEKALARIISRFRTGR